MNDELNEESPLLGHGMAADMAQQPGVVRDLVDRADEIRERTHALVPAPLGGITLVGLGSSRHAALYGRYLLEQVTGRPASLAVPSLYTCYGADVDLSGHLAIGLSRSGSTTDTVETLARMRRGGATTLAVTSDAESPLAEVADTVLELGTGDGRAGPATKTFTAQLATLALLAQALGPVPWRTSDWPGVVDAMESVLGRATSAREMATDALAAETLVGLGRGLLFPTTLEVCAAITATTGMVTSAHTPADLQYGGPVARTRGRLSVLCLATPGPCMQSTANGAQHLANHGCRVWAITDTPERVPAAVGLLPVPGGLPEALTPLVHVLRGQQLARELAFARHLDPDVPSGAPPPRGRRGTAGEGSGAHSDGPTRGTTEDMSSPRSDMDIHELLELTREECLGLLGSEPVGRLVYLDDSDPVALPVNHAMHADDLVFRSAAGSKLSAAKGFGTRVSYEVDDYDSVTRSGWSVLAFGWMEEVTDPEELDALRQLPLRPWADEIERDHWLRVRIDEVTGRRLIGSEP